VAIAARIAATRAFDPSRYLPFELDGEIAGYVRQDLARHLERFPDVFVTGRRVGFHQAVADPATRTGAMARVARDLAAHGLLSPWRDETYAIVAAPGRAPSFDLERAAVRFFGFTAHSVHVNGLTDGGRAMWIAQRSPHKAIDPGMYDNLIGGGIASGTTCEHTLRKEAWEEAGVGPELAAAAVPAARICTQRESADGLHAEIIEIYDIDLPADFVPANQDGEVAGFRRLTLQEVVAELEADAPYTVDAAAVALECLARRGVIRLPAALSSPG
jgi:8-oxo-dGTP pyrophosphatase MutT (NUDIX family)